jgi:uncharacterized repeat protein (TIGR01451 family)
MTPDGVSPTAATIDGAPVSLTTGGLQFTQGEAHFVVAPAHAPGVVTLRVESSDGSSDTKSITYIDLPVIGAPTPISRVSVSAAGVQGTLGGVLAFGSAQPVTDSTGRYVAFHSSFDFGFPITAPFPYLQLYRKDRQTGEVLLVFPTGGFAPGATSMSLDGRRVVFIARPPDSFEGVILASDAPFTSAERVDVNDLGEPANAGPTPNPVRVSGNGRYVAFLSPATNLDATVGDTPDTNDLFVRDLVTKHTERWTTNAHLGETAFVVSISGDGRYVTFVASGLDRLVADDTNSFSDVYLLDRESGNLRVLTAGANAGSNSTQISSDGSTIAFASNATNLVPGDTNNLPDVFVLDRASGAITRVSMGVDGAESNGASNLVALQTISANGRRVMFRSWASNLTSTPTPLGTSHVYVYDRDAGQTVLINAAADGTIGDDLSSIPPGAPSPRFGVGAALTADGRYAVFSSAASNLVPGDTNELNDIFVKQVPEMSGSRADLAVSAIASSASVPQNATLTYTVTVTNNGPATATNVAVSMPWAGGTSIISANSPVGFCIIPIFVGYVTCDGGTIPSGGHATITIAVQPHLAGTLTATFSVSGHESDPVAGNNTTTVDTEIEPSADMAIQVVSPADGTAVQVGAPTTFDVLVSNFGPSTAPVARVRLAIPTTLQNVLASASSASCDTSAGVALCDFDNFGAGGSAHVIFTATPNVLGPVTLTFDASAPVDDPLPANNTARLGLSSGFNVVETIHVADAINNGVGISEVIHVIDGIQSASLSGSPRNPFDILDDEIIRVVDRIQSSAFPLTTDPSAIIDQETIHVADSWTLPTPPVNPAELRLTVSISAAPLVIGSTVRYSVTMSNLGPNGATELRLRVALPAGLRYLSDTAKTCDWKDGIGTCDFGSVKPGWTTTMMIEARLLSGAAAAASFVLSSHESDPNPANNTARVIVDARPTVTINQAAGQTDPAITAPINFSVVFSEPVTGFTSDDLSFAGSQGGHRSLVATVTGSEASYTIAVSGMTRAGQVEVSIPAGAAVDSGGNSSAASSSTDNSILYGVSTVSADVVPSNYGNATVNATRSNGQLSGSLSYKRGPFVFTSVRFTSLVTDDHVATLQGFSGDGRFFATSIGDEPDTFRLWIEGVEQTTDGGILSGTTSVTPWTPDTRLRGWVDLHTHPMSNLAFAGKLFHGAPSENSLVPAIQMPTDPQCRYDVRATDINEALSQDAPTRGDITESVCGDNNKSLVIRVLELAFHANHAPVRSGGYPAFVDWPKWDDITHQKMWIDWIRRAWEGGQRVMVALSHHNHTLSELLGPGGPISGVKDDKASSDLQVTEITRMVDEHPEFMAIARSPQELHAIVEGGKLAVVLGIEIDKIGNFNPNSTPTEQQIDDEIDRLYAQGVRYILPIHVIDNAFGDAALYNPLYNAVNFAESGNFFSVGCGNAADEIGFRLTTFLTPIEQMILPLGVLPTIPALCVQDGRFMGHTNVRMPIGLTARGQFAIRAMMRRGILLDVDHMSNRAANQTLAMAAAIPGGGYPVNSGHSGVRDRSTENNAENARTKAQLAQIACLGGMFGLGTDGIGAYKWAGYYESGYNAMVHAFAPNGTCPSGLPLGNGFMGLGTDANSLVKSPPPPFLPIAQQFRIPDIYNPDPNNDIYQGLPYQNLPYYGLPPGSRPPGMVPLLQSRTGVRTWDYRFDGVAHYGMYVDFLRDVRTWNSSGAMSGRRIVDDQMMYGADYFYRMWLKADTQKARVP